MEALKGGLESATSSKATNNKNRIQQNIIALIIKKEKSITFSVLYHYYVFII